MAFCSNESCSDDDEDGDDDYATLAYLAGDATAIDDEEDEDEDYIPVFFGHKDVCA